MKRIALFLALLAILLTGVAPQSASAQIKAPGRLVGSGLRYPTGGGFTPASIGALVWQDARDSSTITLNGSSFASWANKGSLGGALAQATASAQPAYSATGLNGFPTAVFNSVNTQYLFGSLSLSGPNLMACSVGTINNTATANGARMLSISTGSNDFSSVATAAVIRRQGNNAAMTAERNLAALGVVAISYATPLIICSVFDGANQTLWLNGTASTPVASTGSFASTIFSVGKPANDNGPWDGAIGIMVTTYSVDTTSRQQLEGYIACGWLLQSLLPGGHPYKSSCP